MELRFVRLLKGGPAAPLDNPSLLGKRVPWLKSLQVFASNTLQLNCEPDYKAGRVVGMDAASALAVELLDVQPGMRVLDLCCAPGMKLAAIAELMQKTGTLVGVDVSESRLHTTLAVLRKFRVCCHSSEEAAAAAAEWEVNVFQQDGRVFDFGGTSSRGKLLWNVEMNRIFLGGEGSKPLAVPRKRVSGKSLKKKLARAAAAAAAATQASSEDGDALLFDRVLVDAECTTDARVHNGNSSAADDDDDNEDTTTTTSSSAYVKKPKIFTREEELATEELQFGLLSNGFRQLRPGGTLIYSTCSMQQGQNEDMVLRLLAADSSAKLVQLPQIAELTVQETEVSPEEPIKTWRLTPQVSGTSGLFIAKLTKQSHA